jgi:small subunit ribosomal protein S17
MTAEKSMGTRGIQKRKIGVVISDKMDKTIVVQVERLVAHPVYKKYVKRRNRIKAPDEKNEFQIGARVEIIEATSSSSASRRRSPTAR